MKETQKQMILAHLQTHRDGITPREAEDLYGVMRLASRVSDLKRDGIGIETHRVKSRNRYGKTVSFARYTLRES